MLPVKWVGGLWSVVRGGPWREPLDEYTERTYGAEDESKQPERYSEVGADDRAAHFVQVLNTSGGKPIPEANYEVMVESIRSGLSLQPQDRFLDIGCGNGMMTVDLGRGLKFFVGCDMSATLVKTAVRHYSAPNGRYYCMRLTESAADVAKVREHGSFNKFNLYGVVQYLTTSAFERTLELVKELAQGEPCQLYIGAIADRERRHRFYRTRKQKWQAFMRFVRRESDVLGRWWTFGEIERCAKRFGGTCERVEQDPKLHNSHFRFDCCITFAAA
mmetsp:Transcript_12631/g.41626  ORF Transcript_12631/g.41626 Transcript_12631/m.41626 type:complete len:274 (-) Transcript_12631:98-919(-)